MDPLLFYLLLQFATYNADDDFKSSQWGNQNEQPHLKYSYHLNKHSDLNISLPNAVYGKYVQIVRHKRKASDRSIANLRKHLNDERIKQELLGGNKSTGFENANKGDGKFGGLITKQEDSKFDDKIRLVHKKQHLENLEYPVVSQTDCNFEDDCLWTWRKDIANGFFITTGTGLQADEAGPKTDASNREYGSYLLLHTTSSPEEFHVTSPLFSSTKHSCRLEVWIYQEGMEHAEIRVVIDKFISSSTYINNHTQWVLDHIKGDDSKKWKKHVMSIGRVSENFTVILEVVTERNRVLNGTVAFDNIALTNCYPKNEDMCSPLQYRCTSSTNCINNTRVCDISLDCQDGEDERQNCNQMPYGARCSFEDDMCGWYSIDGKSLEWVRHNGSTPTNFTGPNFDHTYMNSTGKYLYVNMLKEDVKFGSSATLKSMIFNPPPTVHGNISSRYYNSCAIRFYLHKTGKHRSGILLQVTELRPNYNHSNDILWSYEDLGDRWVRKVLILPNITYRYFLIFEAKRGLRYISDIAIDDVSLSPECFGLNIPTEDLNGYNYYDPTDGSTFGKERHTDFINKTIYEITTCGNKGKYGPTSAACAEHYSDTEVKVRVQNNGEQKWVVPADGPYTFLIFGASGGKGSGGMGSSRGAMVRTVIQLKEGQEIIFLVGQEGSSACVKTLHGQGTSSCYSSDHQNDTKGIRGVLNLDITDGGGGGGGATYVFLNKSHKVIPIAVAAGGGGLGLGRFIDTGEQHGQAINMSKPPVTGKMYGKRASGAGGGWYSFSGLVEASHSLMMGRSFLDGGIGGKACYNSSDGRGDGGFGGGGGGCRYGGGGGGYAGGDASSGNNTNGRGGYSFLDPSWSIPNLSDTHSAYNSGPGYVTIIPGISGCGCDYRCVALDARRSLVKCICPPNWKLDQGGKVCLQEPGMLENSNNPWVVIGLLGIVLCLTITLAIFCFILYNRYQLRASGLSRRKMMNGADLQLDRLRMTSDNMMTEYNPNYEFGGQTYSVKDLNGIPREQLRLVKALGQGAFGEVYQGFYRQRPCDTVEMPVAVKTLPEMSTSQAEMDFLMEALIMSKFNHANIVHFIGVCFDKHPRFIVLELLAGGDLKNFLRESRPKPERGSSLTMKDLVLISVDVAKGCKYLEEHRFVHRDIAARNCLLTTKGPGRVAKIADFGMSRDVYRSDYYRKDGKAMLPIKWMPPEAFLDGIFTSKTDVWSFGVLLWEIMSMGYMPYTGCSNKEVMDLVARGGRLDRPANCPDPIYGLMTQCWDPAAECRPSFATILERLGYCAQDPDVMNAPLPVFHRLPSNERDATVMRPISAEENCLQIIPQSSDYLIPNHASVPDTLSSSSSVEKLLPENSDSWETSFIMSRSKSTQPLLNGNDPGLIEENSTADKLLPLNEAKTKISPDLLTNNMVTKSNNNIHETSTIKSGVSLDAGALAKQNQSKYANMKQDDVVSNGLNRSSPFQQNKPSNKLFSDPTVNC